MNKVVSTILVITLLLFASENARAENTWRTAGLGVGSVFCSLFYSPAKVLYAAGGLITGSLAYLVTIGDQETANNIFVPTLRGTYIITPANLTGEEDVHFVGHYEESEITPKY